MIAGVDYSTDHPSAAELAARGMGFAGRYVGLGGQGKQLTSPELLALSRHGISVVMLAEADARGALGGWAAGAQHAGVVRAAAQRLGAPPSAPIYFAVDFDAQPPQMPRVRDYFRGVASVLGRARTGVYGGYGVVADLLAGGLAAWAFQTYAWSGGRWHPGAQLRQLRNGVRLGAGTVDLCVATVANYGGWRIGVDDQGVEGTAMDDELRRAIHHIGWRQYGALVGLDPIPVPAAPELGIAAYTIPNMPLRELRALVAGISRAPITEADREGMVAAVGLHAALGGLPDSHLPEALLTQLAPAPAPPHP